MQELLLDTRETVMPAHIAASFSPSTLQPVMDIDTSHSYYRSQAFTSRTGLNPLVTAAAPLLTLLGRMHIQSQPVETNLYQYLVHEIKAFESNVEIHGYAADILIAARYILCITLDEALAQLQPTHATTWQPCLLPTFHPEAYEMDGFFTLLNRLSDDPVSNIDILELMYICLSLGYQGKYRQQTNGRQQLEQLKNQLYNHIRKERGEFKKSLLVGTLQDLPSATGQKKLKLMPLWLTFIFSLLIISAVHFGLGYLLNTVAAPVYQEFIKVQQILTTLITMT